MVEMVLHRRLDQLLRFRRRQPILGLGLELRLRDEQRQQDARAHQRIVRRQLARLAVVDQRREALQPLDDRGAEPGLVRAALRRGDCVAIPTVGAIGRHRPVDRPLHSPLILAELVRARERLVGNGRLARHILGQMVRQTAWEDEGLRLRHLLARQLGRATPADFHAAEQIGLGSRQPVKAVSGKAHPRAEDLRVGPEGHGRAAPIRRRPHILHRPQRRPPGIALPPQGAIARHLHRQLLGQRIHHRDAHAVQAARCRIGPGSELPAGMQHGQDHFQRGLVREAGVRIDRDAPAIVADRQRAVGGQLHLDAAGMAGNRLVHGIVQDLGGQVVQRVGIGAADIHARPAPHRLQPLEHFDGRGIIAPGRIGSAGRSAGEKIGHAAVIATGSSQGNGPRGKAGGYWTTRLLQCSHMA